VRDLHRLQEEIVRSRLVPFPHQLRVWIAREHEDGQRGPVPFADARAGLEPADAGKPDVEQHQVEAGRGELLEGLFARFRAGEIVAMVGQDVHQRLCNARVDVDDQDPGGHFFDPWDAACLSWAKGRPQGVRGWMVAPGGAGCNFAPSSFAPVTKPLRCWTSIMVIISLGLALFLLGIGVIGR